MSNLENEKDMWADIVANDRPRGGDFGKGPALRKNEGGRGYHYRGAPGFEDDEISGGSIRRVGYHPDD